MAQPGGGLVSLERARERGRERCGYASTIEGRKRRMHMERRRKEEKRREGEKREIYIYTHRRKRGV